jgi:hypothetical protein
MQRRDFLTATAAAAAAVPSLTALAQSGGGISTELAHIPFDYLEWRTYRLDDAAKQPLVAKYLQSALAPACKRHSVQVLGPFKEIGAVATPSLHALFAYSTNLGLATFRPAIEADAEYQKAAAEYLSVGKNAPAFVRIDSSLMLPFQGMPTVATPEGQPQVFELRTYESHSEERARKKIDMFNNGEIPLFVEAGFQNIFFGETLIGEDLPNLKYLLASPDMDANKASWEKFKALPGWLAIRDLPEYKDTVSKATPLFLELMP